MPTFPVSPLHLDTLVRLRGVDALDEIEFRFKDRARRLKSELSTVSLMRLQEAMSRALGFPRFHALKEALKSWRLEVAAFSTKARWSALRLDARHIAFAPVASLNLRLDERIPLTPAEAMYLARLCESLATTLTTSADLMRNAVAIAWGHEESWNGLITRPPPKAPSVIDDFLSGSEPWHNLVNRGLLAKLGPEVFATISTIATGKLRHNLPGIPPPQVLADLWDWDEGMANFVLLSLNNLGITPEAVYRYGDDMVFPGSRIDVARTPDTVSAPK